MIEDKLTLGKTLKEYRKRSGLTQAELAKEIDLSRSYLSDVENDRKNPSVLTVENILESLGVKVSFAEYLEKSLREVNPMTTETNAERLENIKDNCEKLAKYERDYGSDDVNINPIVKDMEWLIRQAERVQELERALEFYADEDIYEWFEDGNGYTNTKVLEDNGDTARQALKGEST